SEREIVVLVASLVRLAPRVLVGHAARLDVVGQRRHFVDQVAGDEGRIRVVYPKPSPSCGMVTPISHRTRSIKSLMPKWRSRASISWAKRRNSGMATWPPGPSRHSRYR